MSNSVGREAWTDSVPSPGRGSLRMRCRCRGMFRAYGKRHLPFYYPPSSGQYQDTLELRLQMMASANNTYWLPWLLQRGVNPNAADMLGRTALHMAASKGHVEAVRLLLSHGANPNLTDALGNTPLHLAACTSNLPLVTLLLNSGTDVSAQDGLGRSALALAQSKLRLMQTRSKQMEADKSGSEEGARVEEGQGEGVGVKAKFGGHWMEELQQVVELIRAFLRRTKPIPLVSPPDAAPASLDSSSSSSVPPTTPSPDSSAEQLHLLLSRVSLEGRSGRSADFSELLQALDNLHLQPSSSSSEAKEGDTSAPPK